MNLLVLVHVFGFVLFHIIINVQCFRVKRNAIYILSVFPLYHIIYATHMSVFVSLVRLVQYNM